MIKVQPVQPKPELPLKCEVLSVIAPFPSWVNYRRDRLGAFLAGQEIAHGCTFAKSFEHLVAAVEASECKVLLNETWLISPIVIQELALLFPGVRFVNLTHASPAYIASHKPVDHLTCLEMATDMSNVYYGHVSQGTNLSAPKGCKKVYLPNIVTLPSEGRPGRRGKAKTLTVSLIARTSVEKNWGGMLMGIALAAKKLPLKVLLSEQGAREGNLAHQRYLDLLDIDYDVLPWGCWEAYMSRVETGVDIGLCCGFTDSFNLVAAEHCLLGRPVVGSFALDWLPKHWRANPQSPAAIAAVIIAHAADLDYRSQRAQQIAEKVAAKNAKSLVHNLGRLIGI